VGKDITIPFKVLRMLAYSASGSRHPLRFKRVIWSPAGPMLMANIAQLRVGCDGFIGME